MTRKLKTRSTRLQNAIYRVEVSGEPPSTGGGPTGSAAACEQEKPWRRYRLTHVRVQWQQKERGKWVKRQRTMEHGTFAQLYSQKPPIGGDQVLTARKKSASTSYAAPLDYTHPKANMHGCQPCPKCKSRFRWPNQRGEVICDDCGLVQELEKEQHNTPIELRSNL